MAKRAEYKVIAGPEGLRQLEERVTKLLNEGWKLQGGIGFNGGYAYQAMARMVEVKPAVKGKALGANDAMRALDDLV